MKQLTPASIERYSTNIRMAPKDIKGAAVPADNNPDKRCMDSPIAVTGTTPTSPPPAFHIQRKLSSVINDGVEQESDIATAAVAKPNLIYFPAITDDYVLKNMNRYSEGYGEGLAIVANRNIKKGDEIFKDSLEFNFADAQEGDYLLFVGHKEASKRTETDVPSTMPIDEDILLDEHGVARLLEDPSGKSGGIVSWCLEAPTMLMNHSCEPNTTCFDRFNGEDVAARGIRKGEELTTNYCLDVYDSWEEWHPEMRPSDDSSFSSSDEEDKTVEKCLCGSKNCKGRLMGFKELRQEEKEEMLSFASPAVQATYRGDIGETAPVKYQQERFPRRTEGDIDADAVPRLVFPGPGDSGGEKVKIEKDGSLVALQDFAFGEKVYEFWRMDWPFGGHSSIDWVASTKKSKGDLPEGTTIHVDPTKCSAAKDRSGHYQFSGFDLLTTHSCEPNLCYSDYKDNEEDSWQSAFATRDIKAGEKLTVDINSILWDRSDSAAAGECNCGAAKCTGTTKGFKFLPRAAQLERKLMTWRRVCPPYEGEDPEYTKYLGMALSPHVRECWRADDELCKDFDVESASRSSNSSSDSSEWDEDSSSDDEDEE